MPLTIKIKNEDFILLPQKAIFRPLSQTLIIADTHFGKSTHFQKAGIPVPTSILDDDLETLSKLIGQWKPEQLIILGDMFHSQHNGEVEVFKEWLSCCVGHKTILVKGNHDILSDEIYNNLGLDVKHIISSGDFIFTHDNKKPEKEKFYFKGHIHPGARVTMARQNLHSLVSTLVKTISRYLLLGVSRAWPLLIHCPAKIYL